MSNYEEYNLAKIYEQEDIIKKTEPTNSIVNHFPRITKNHFSIIWFCKK